MTEGECGKAYDDLGGRVPENARRSRILADPSRAYATRADERGLPMVMKPFSGERRCAAFTRQSAPGDR